MRNEQPLLTQLCENQRACDYGTVNSELPPGWVVRAKQRRLESEQAQAEARARELLLEEQRRELAAREAAREGLRSHAIR